MIDNVTDRIPDIVARMGQLSLDSTVRECVALRVDWVKSLRALDASRDFDLACRVKSKIMLSREYENYLEVTKDLFGRKREPTAVDLLLPVKL